MGKRPPRAVIYQFATDLMDHVMELHRVKIEKKKKSLSNHKYSSLFTETSKIFVEDVIFSCGNILWDHLEYHPLHFIIDKHTFDRCAKSWRDESRREKYTEKTFYKLCTFIAIWSVYCFMRGYMEAPIHGRLYIFHIAKSVLKHGNFAESKW